MKRLLIGVLCFILIGLTACGDKSDGLVSGTDVEAETDQDVYSGVYHDYDVNEPNLMIQKNDDGTYGIQIGIYRLVNLEDGVGNATEHGIAFTVTAPNGKNINGTVTVDGDIATVTFDSAEWSEYSSINEYQYYKVSEMMDK